MALEAGSVAYEGGVSGLFADTALIGRLGLALPAAADLALELAVRGRSLKPLPLTLDELTTALEASG